MKFDKSGKFITSIAIFDNEKFSINKETHQLSNGQKHEYTVVHAVNWASIIPITKDGNFVMVYQYRAGWRKGSLEFPAGRGEDGEDLISTAKRELREETGFVAETWENLGIANPVTWTNQEVGIFLATDLKFENMDLDDEEDIEVVTINPSDFWNYVKKGIITDSPTIASWAYWNNYNDSHKSIS